jgi:hypothetical protein
MNKIEEALERWCSGEGIRFDSQEAKEQYQKSNIKKEPGV